MINEPRLLPVWSALADSKRRLIVQLLEEKPRTTTDLCGYFEVSRYAVMKHLKVLEEAGLVTVKREGRKRWNILNQRMVRMIRSGLVEAYDEERNSLSGVPGMSSEGVQGPPWIPAAVGTVGIEKEIHLQADPENVFRELTVNIDHWWEPEALREARRFVLEPYLNGRFYEAYDRTGQGELYATVTCIRTGSELRLAGPMGIADRAAISTVRFLLEPYAQGSRLYVTHRITGEVDRSLQDIVSDHWDDRLNHRLKRLVEGESPSQSVATGASSATPGDSG